MTIHDTKLFLYILRVVYGCETVGDAMNMLKIRRAQIMYAMKILSKV